MCIFTCVGYAAVDGALFADGSLEAKWPYALYITDTTQTSSTAGGSITVNSRSITVVNLSTQLGNDASSSSTLRVTLFNNTKDYYAFKGVDYTVGEHTYNNTNIVFDVSGITLGQKLIPGETIQIDLTFHYDNYRGYAEALSAVLNFHFGLSGAQDGTDYESYVMYFLSNANEYGLNDSHKGHVLYNALVRQNLIYADDSVSAGNLKHLLSGMNTNQTNQLTFVSQYVSDTQIVLYTYEDIYNSSSYQGQKPTVYRTTFVRESIGSSYSLWEPFESVGGTAEIQYIPSKSLYAINVETWRRATV